ncbi:MAG: pilus assembly protein N-terminal domain-containing protein [Methylocystis sp.]|nr:pilus assembly protein N-terminal domain-containing protein [Methylocystis sp.]
MSSRRLLRWLGLLAFAVIGLQTRALANDKAILVDLDRARVVRMPEGAQTLVVGNPMVADITMLKSNQLMVITGKSFGTTNLILLDQTGNQVGETTIHVLPNKDNLVVQRGLRRESYSCYPDCTPTIDLADDKEYLAQTIETMRSHESSSSPPKR